MAYSVSFQIESRARTYKGINKAVKKQTCFDQDEFESQEQLEKSIKDGFVEFIGRKIIFYVDGE